MDDNTLLSLVTAKAQEWLKGNYDAETKAEVQKMLDNEDKSQLIDAFYKDLEFGTGGLRGIMGAGTNRMNIYTVGAATQGLSNYLLEEFSDKDEIKVVVGYDCRNNSRKFAEITANILSANGIKVYLFEDLRPTPAVSYAIRKLGCQSGIMITASHNPKEYNGYKVYWNDGAQNLYEKKKTDAVNYLTNYTNSIIKDGVAQWKKLGEYLLVKYMDGVIKKEENGVFKRNPYGKPTSPNRPGYPEDHYRRIIKETGNRYKVIPIN
jgi:phosphomannomutase